MEQTTKTTFDKSAYNPVLFTSYKIAKKLIKYSFYIALIYFAYEGFMAWD
ncbi:hypothetical protein MUU74_10975 [Chryseobacterium daecheongense]|nr:hypothetical protein [Chryseobacterium daecheongense]UOU97017.1 hypothetical protein MUU74_10975 [Chryseobacterium daecheongense]